MISAAKTDLSVILNDLHIPHHDRAAVATTLEFIGYLKPSHIFLNGDIVDFMPLSKFEMSPGDRLNLKLELMELRRFLTLLRAVAPKAEITYTEGNHEHRLIRYLWSQAKEMSSLDALQPERLLMLDEFRIRWVPQEITLEFHGLLVTHGERVSKHSGYSARQEMEKYGTSGISGHTHRMGAHYLTNHGGSHVWFENGCLCDLRPGYIKGKPNWQHGFAIGEYIEGEDRFQIQQIHIDSKNRILYHGKLFTGQSPPKHLKNKRQHLPLLWPKATKSPLQKEQAKESP